MSRINHIECQNPLLRRESIPCKINEEEHKHLIHQANKIGNYIRKKMFFPFRLEKRHQNSMTSAELFWETSFYDGDYPSKKEIREHFNRYEQSIEIEQDGKKIELKCLVIESKDYNEGDPCCNHLIVQGNTSNLDNNTPGIYPFLEGYLREKESNPEIPAGRFIVCNHYDNSIIKPDGTKKIYLPGDMDEWGFLFKKTLETFTEKYGKFQSISAHSLGNIPIVAQLKHFDREDFERLFPRTLFLSKGPSSLYEVSKNVPFELGVYPWGWLFLIGPIIYFLAKLTGWTLELDQTLIEFLKNVPQNPETIEQLKNTNIIISEVKHDFYFPGKASLCASTKINELENEPLNLYRVSFNPPPTRTTKKGQHNYNLGAFQRQYLFKEKLHINGQEIHSSRQYEEIFHKQIEHALFLNHGESIPDLVLRTSSFNIN